MHTSKERHICSCERPPQTASRKILGINVTVLPTIAAALLPKCPFCLAAYLSILSSIGINVSIDSTSYNSVIVPVTVALVTLSIVMIGVRARRAHNYGPLFVAAVAALFVLIGKFILNYNAAIYLGSGIMIVTSIWSTGRKTTRMVP